ncbi:exported hypothetical protein [Vibrio nigripulchritudo FTn2]|uniref:hypothetical protein n=1 Tax=Vibrio nigripulchritudo TaxID=28173 RepID=UPI0003B17BEF|nr:hypothetical protein [Vibrio nigripulchritudo]CCN40133.1 exported hypothetical protein [Vibrio nigripulchritudo FTn2]
MILNNPSFGVIPNISNTLKFSAIITALLTLPGCVANISLSQAAELNALEVIRTMFSETTAIYTIFNNGGWYGFESFIVTFKWSMWL